MEDSPPAMLSHEGKRVTRYSNEYAVTKDMVPGTRPMSTVWDTPDEGRKQLDSDERYFKLWSLNKVRYQSEDGVKFITIFPDGQLREMVEKYEPNETYNQGEVLREMYNICTSQQHNVHERDEAIILERPIDFDITAPYVAAGQYQRFDRTLSDSEGRVTYGFFGKNWGLDRAIWDDEKGILSVPDQDHSERPWKDIFTLRMFKTVGRVLEVDLFQHF